MSVRFRGALSVLTSTGPFSMTRMCFYSDVPGANWVIDYHPKFPSLLVATGGSGHAFKVSMEISHSFRCRLTQWVSSSCLSLATSSGIDWKGRWARSMLPNGLWCHEVGSIRLERPCSRGRSTRHLLLQQEASLHDSRISKGSSSRRRTNYTYVPMHILVVSM